MQEKKVTIRKKVYAIFLHPVIMLNKEEVISITPYLLQTNNKTKEILLNVAITINKELFEDNKISYEAFKYTEEQLLNEQKSLSKKDN